MLGECSASATSAATTAIEISQSYSYSYPCSCPCHAHCSHSVMQSCSHRATSAMQPWRVLSLCSLPSHCSNEDVSVSCSYPSSYPCLLQSCSHVVMQSCSRAVMRLCGHCSHFSLEEFSVTANLESS